MKGPSSGTPLSSPADSNDQDKSVVVALGLVWIAHIGLDRLVGYGLRYADHFQTPI